LTFCLESLPLQLSAALLDFGCLAQDITHEFIDTMSECCEADVRREALEVCERVERPDLCDLERADGGGARGIKGTGRAYGGILAPVRYATSLYVLDKVEEGVSLPDLRTDLTCFTY